MDRRDFIKGLSLGTLPFLWPGCGSLSRRSSGDDPPRPNILFIIADDLGWRDVGFHDSEILTPNIDRLAREGVRFEQHYAMASCSPTRCGLLTGRYPSRFGVHSPTNRRVFGSQTITLPRALRDCGYATSITGKWHLGSKPEWGPLQAGFDQSYGTLAGGVTPYTHRYKEGPYTNTWHRNDRLIQEEGHVTDLIGREANLVLEESAKNGKPFFLYLAFTAPHHPIKEPERWMRMYDGRIEDLSRKTYAACVTHMDSVIGTLVETLARTGQLRTTLIVFTSDNGGENGWRPSGAYPGEEAFIPTPVEGDNSPYRGWKTQLYEGGIRVPAVANWAGGLAPGHVLSPVHIVDWMPTLCTLAGFRPTGDPQWDGRNIWPLLQDTTTRTEPRTLYWREGDDVAVREEDWKLVRMEKKQELFNIEADPCEQKDLALENPEIVLRLQELLRQIQMKDAKEAIPFW